ncbi:MAG: heme exporter protein CcmB [Acidimicrobiales bacterium]
MWRDAALVCGKDLRIEARSMVTINQVVPFAAVVVLLFGLALGPDRSVLAPLAAGLFWVAVLLSTILAVQRAFAVESAEGARDVLRLSGLDPAGIFLGKAAAVLAELVVLEAVLGAAIAVLYGVRLDGAAVLFAASILASVGLSAVGVLYGALSAGLAGRETLLPLLFLPIVAPVLLGATKACDLAIAGTPGGAEGWLMLVGIFAVLYLAAGTIMFGSLLEER